MLELHTLSGTAEELSAVQCLLDSAPDYAIAIQGEPFDDGEAARTFEEMPPGVDRSAKVVLGVYLGGELVGVIDLVRGFPVPSTAMLGLLLIAGTHHRRGLGAQAVAAIETLVSSWGSLDRIRIGVVRSNAKAFGFWEAMGYSATGESRPWEEGSVRSEVIVMEKLLG